jgi:hypothetical protein
MSIFKFTRARRVLTKMKVMGKSCNPVSYQDVSYTEKPDNAVEKRIDAHDLFSMFTGNMIKEKMKWFR